jgi:hypothetical protein
MNLIVCRIKGGKINSPRVFGNLDGDIVVLANSHENVAAQAQNTQAYVESALKG